MLRTASPPWGAGVLLALVLALLAAPALGLRDPLAQPDGLVLRYLPPLSRVDAIRLDDGSLRYAHELQRGADGSVRYRRGTSWRRLASSELAEDWHAHPLYVLGTDAYGRDLASRLLHGARVSLGIGAIAALLALAIGSGVGLAAGLAGGFVDGVLMRGTDVALAIPRLFLAMLAVSLYGASLATTVVVLGATTWMAAARLVRGEVLALRGRDFVLAARAAGASPFRLALRHVFPGTLVAVVVEGTLRVGDTILLESALSFLGLGVPPPSPSWGNLVAEGRHDLLDAWWIATLPGLAIALTVIALHLVAASASARLGARASLPERTIVRSAAARAA